MQNVKKGKIFQVNKNSNDKKWLRRGYKGYLWILPGVLLLILFEYLPPLMAFVYSFTDWNGSVVNNFVGFSNFVEVLTNPEFWSSMKNAVIIMLFNVFVGSILADVTLAELIYNLKSERFSKFFRFLFILPMLIPGMVNMLVWTKVILTASETGLANRILAFFHLPASTWFASEKTGLVSILVMGFPWIGGTSFLIYLAGLMNIPDSVVEAARLDGVNVFQRIIYFDLPYLLGQIKYFIVLGFINGFQNFGLQLLITGGENGTMVPAYLMYREAMSYSKYGVACAYGMILFILTFTITLINNKFLKSTEDKLEG